jgi:hypothetical protein
MHCCYSKHCRPHPVPTQAEVSQSCENLSRGTCAIASSSTRSTARCFCSRTVAPTRAIISDSTTALVKKAEAKLLLERAAQASQSTRHSPAATGVICGTRSRRRRRLLLTTTPCSTPWCRNGSTAPADPGDCSSALSLRVRPAVGRPAQARANRLPGQR